MNKDHPIKIVTRTNKGEVVTVFSDDPFHDTKWTTHLAVPANGLPILKITKMLYTDSYKNAGENHLLLCGEIR